MNSKSIASALFSLLQQGTPLETVVEGFERYIQKNHLEGLVPNILWYLAYYADRQQRNESVELVVAHDVSTDLASEIASFVGAPSTSRVQTQKDASIIAGFIARYDGTEYDASAKTQLARLRKAIIYS